MIKDKFWYVSVQLKRTSAYRDYNKLQSDDNSSTNKEGREKTFSDQQVIFISMKVIFNRFTLFGDEEQQ